MPKVILPETVDQIESDLAKGYPLITAAGNAGVSEPTARKYIKERQTQRKLAKAKLKEYDPFGADLRPKPQRGIMSGNNIAAPIDYDDLGPDAKRALDDPSYFAERYFGVILLPFQVEWMITAQQSLNSDEQEFLCINITTGAGKSTLLVILAAWMICKERRIRGMFGSFTQGKAEQQLARLANALERTTPTKAKYSDLKSGMAKDAVATLIEDFGLFHHPGARDIWRQSAIQVMLIGDEISSEKEPTWQAYGWGGDVVGNRMDFAIWDDVWSPGKLKSEDARSGFLRFWEDEAEERIEPAGTLMLAMQRLEPNDLSRFVLDKKVPLADAPESIRNVFHDDDYSGDDLESEDQEQMVGVYRHIVFKAHYDDRCQGDHGKDATPYPEGCLLYPKRVPWVKIQRAKHTNEGKYRLVYQQEDNELPDQLVHPLWVNGGVGADGVEYPGCWDNDRDTCQIPLLSQPTLSVMTVDPSPENYWGIIWWVYHVETEQRFLIDLDNHKLKVPNWLAKDPNTGEWTGLAHEWVLRSRDLGHPITHIIFEKNQGHWFFQDPNSMQWAREMGVRLIPHETYRNKSDAEMGVGVLSDVYRFGRIRLPGSFKGFGRYKSQALVREATTYTGLRGTRSDLVMSQWFLEWNLPKLIPSLKRLPKLPTLNFTMKKVG